MSYRICTFRDPVPVHGNAKKTPKNSLVPVPGAIFLNNAAMQTDKPTVMTRMDFGKHDFDVYKESLNAVSWCSTQQTNRDKFQSS